MSDQPSSRPETDLAPGTIVAGRFRLESVLGTGGYGSVYAATQLNIGRRVAIKLLHAHVLGRGNARARFDREARLAQQLSHPNNVRLFDFGTSEDGRAFIVWEKLEGRSLDVEIARAALSTARAVRVASQVLKALAEAHSLGIIHRDIKPANVFLCDFVGEPDFVKVLDYGIATSTKEDEVGLTQEGVALGTASYMSPEQVRGEPVDARTDLYSLGLVLGEMLSGEPVFRGSSSLDVAVKQISSDPVPHAAATRASPLHPLVARATAKNREHRFGSAHEMLAAMLEVRTDGATASGSSAPSVGDARPTSDERVFDSTALPNHVVMHAMHAMHPAWQSETHVAVEVPKTQASMQASPAVTQASMQPLRSVTQPSAPPMHAVTRASMHVPPQPALPFTAGGGPSVDRARRPSSRGWVVLLAVVGLVVVGALGALVIRARHARDASKSEDRDATKERRASKTSDADEAEPDFEKLAFDYAKLALQNPKKPCRPIDADLGSWNVRGVNLDTLITRAERAGYVCKRHVVVGTNGVYEFEKPGQSRVIAMHYQGLVSVVQRAPGSRTITDEEGKRSLTVVASDSSTKATSAFAEAIAE